MASLEPAIRLFHHRWSVPITARLYREGPQTFAYLAREMGASRDTLSHTLARMEENGVLVRRGGERPLWDLTAIGREVGAACIDAVEAVGSFESDDIVNLALRKWPMIVLTAIGRGGSRYNELKGMLPGVTARALALALKDLQANGLVIRTVEDGYPPTSLYALSEDGKRLFPAMDRVCRAADGAVGD